MSVETEKRTYLTVILPNCYSSEQVQYQALKLLFVHSQTIYIISHGANIHQVTTNNIKSQSNHVLCENYTFET